MKEIFAKIEASFKRAMNGEERLETVIWWWGVLGYLVAYFIVDKIVKVSDLRSIDIIVSILTVIYFSWHIYVLRKCAPKKPQLSKEEKERIRLEQRRLRWKKFLRKLFLQEPISKWDPVVVTMVTDVFVIACFLDYVVR